MYDGLVAGWKRNRAERLSPRDSGLIPTWQVGIEQPQSSDPRRYITDGYGKNSLLFSCIAEKATSFASLKAQVVRRGGIVAGEHRVSRLLANPNTYQDGLDFAEMLVTQLEAAGNAYIEKVRVSDDAGRRSEFATYPVQALELVRPDYVTIDPGGRREDDGPAPDEGIDETSRQGRGGRRDQRQLVRLPARPLDERDQSRRRLDTGTGEPRERQLGDHRTATPGGRPGRLR